MSHTDLAKSAPTQTLPRRNFLAGLAKLPLIGGSVALLGAPSAVAEPITPDLLEAYKTWLVLEHKSLCWEMAGDPLYQERYCPADSRAELSRTIGGYLKLVGDTGSYHACRRSQPSARAALVLGAVDCSWTDRI